MEKNNKLDINSIIEYFSTERVIQYKTVRKKETAINLKIIECENDVIKYNILTPNSKTEIFNYETDIDSLINYLETPENKKVLELYETWYKLTKIKNA